MKEIAELEAELTALEKKMARTFDEDEWQKLFLKRSEIYAELNAIYEFEVEKNEVH